MDTRKNPSGLIQEMIPCFCKAILADENPPHPYQGGSPQKVPLTMGIWGGLETGYTTDSVVSDNPIECIVMGVALGWQLR